VIFRVEPQGDRLRPMALISALPPLPPHEGGLVGQDYPAPAVQVHSGGSAESATPRDKAISSANVVCLFMVFPLSASRQIRRRTPYPVMPTSRNAPPGIQRFPAEVAELVGSSMYWEA